MVWIRGKFKLKIDRSVKTRGKNIGQFAHSVLVMVSWSLQLEI